MSEIVRALTRGHHRKALTLLREVGPEISEEDRDRVLRQAAISGFVEVARAALDLGARVDAPDHEGGTPLMAAAHLKRADCVRLLLDRGADPNRVRADGRTPLMQAARGGDADCVNALIAAGADLDARTPDGRECPLTAAAGDGNWAAVEALLDAGARADVADAHGRPLLASILRSAVHLVGPALANGAEVAAIDPLGGGRPLHACAEAGAAGAVDALLAHGADLEARDDAGRTPLLAAAGSELRRGDVPATVRVLLAAGADRRATGSDGANALARAAALPDPDVALRVVDLLLEAGTPPEPPTARGRSGLHAAAQAGRLEVLNRLLDAGAALEYRSPEGFTALLFAARTGTGAVECAKMLLYRGADVDVRADDGHGAVTLAAMRGSVPMLRLLVEHGAPLQPRDDSDPVPLVRAAAARRPTMVRALLDLGLDPNLPERGVPALDAPCFTGDARGVALLLDGGANPNLGSPRPLIRALQCGTEVLMDGRPYRRPTSRRSDPAAEVVELLLAAGADPDPPRDGPSALELAERYRCPEVVAMLRAARSRPRAP